METLKDIFVPYEIAIKLKEIGFDETCVAYFEKDNIYPRLNDKSYKVIKHNRLLNFISAPTYEQVFKWFREKGLFGNISTAELDTSIKVVSPLKKYDNVIGKPLWQSYKGENHYQQRTNQNFRIGIK